MINPQITLIQGQKCQIDATSYLGYKETKGKIVLGDQVRIRHNCVLRTCGGTISIGNRSMVNYGVIMHGLGNISIGNDVLISPGVSIYAQNHGIAKNQLIAKQKQTGDGVIIEDDVWIGAGAIILDGVTIRTGAVIGAGAVVTNYVPAYEIWAGNVAKKIGERK